MLTKEENEVVTTRRGVATGGLSDTRSLRILDETGAADTLHAMASVTTNLPQVVDPEDCGECWGECRF